MRFYYQYDENDWVSATVKSAGTPLGRSQLALDIPLPEGLKKFNPIAKTIEFYKVTYDKNNGDAVGTEKDDKKSTILIDDAKIIQV